MSGVNDKQYFGLIYRSSSRKYFKYILRHEAKLNQCFRHWHCKPGVWADMIVTIVLRSESNSVELIGCWSSSSVYSFVTEEIQSFCPTCHLSGSTKCRRGKDPIRNCPYLISFFYDYYLNKKFVFQRRRIYSKDLWYIQGVVTCLHLDTLKVDKSIFSFTYNKNPDIFSFYPSWFERTMQGFI